MILSEPVKEDTTNSEKMINCLGMEIYIWFLL